MRLELVAISDTHGRHRELRLPAGDILVHAGDITRRGHPSELIDFNAWLGEQPHRHKLVIAGNHDFCFERDREASARLLTNAVYLQDEAWELAGLRFWGSPWQPRFCDWAFNLDRGAELRRKWQQIPERTDVLITHGPAFGHGDRTVRGEHVGCRDLGERLGRLRPRLHVFGHIHEAAGHSRDEHTVFLNASSCDLGYRPRNPPLLHSLETGGWEA